jgi:hypothetical protein
MPDRTFYVYEDWTFEAVPRPFYVGKGNDDRIMGEERNQKHTHVVQKHGMVRRVVLATSNEVEAFSTEVRLIVERHTFIRDPLRSSIACNFTKGGDGVAGINERWVEQHDGAMLVRKFSSLREVAEHFHVTRGAVSNALRGRSVFPMSMRSFRWVVEPSRNKEQKPAHGNSMPILELDPVTLAVKREHASITEALRHAGVAYTTFANALRNTEPRYRDLLAKRTGSLWVFKEQRHVAGIEHCSRTPAPSTSKPVIVKAQGQQQTFSSVARAARYLGTHPDDLLKVLHGDRPQSGDYVCEFANAADVRRDVFRSDDWHHAMQGANGIVISKLDDELNATKTYPSFAAAEHGEGYLHRELYTALQVATMVTMPDGQKWRVEVPCPK